MYFRIPTWHIRGRVGQFDSKKASRVALIVQDWPKRALEPGKIEKSRKLRVTETDKPSPQPKSRAQPGTSSKNELDGVNGGRYRIRTYDFHRVRMALYR